MHYIYSIKIIRFPTHPQLFDYANFITLKLNVYSVSYNSAKIQNLYP